jgi:hypothetical protein
VVERTIAIGQRPQQHSVHNGEDGSRHPNSECQGEFGRTASFTADRRIVLYQIGHLKVQKLDTVISKIVEILQR